ncbi:MAG TPA: hypothetical protein VNA27_14340 [Rubrobacteraceae bacterium]|nr:hypothetical protein [Rubrobacteraceae bacterium]
MAIEGLLEYDELRAKLATFDETRKTAERELEALKGHKERVEELERDRDTILEHYASMAPEALNSLSSEERHRLYKMLRVRATVHVDGTLEVSRTLAGPVGVSNLKTAPSYKLFIALGARSR